MIFLILDILLPNQKLDIMINLKQILLACSFIVIVPFGVNASIPGNNRNVIFTQVQISGDPFDPEEGEYLDRRPNRKMECTIDPQDGVLFLSGETPDFILYEIYDCNNICVGAYGDEPEFIDALFSLTGEYRISLSTAEVSYTGYVNI